MQVELDGEHIANEAQFHAAIVKALDLGGHYGRNLDALWDVLTTDVERPVTLVWRDSTVSRQAMPERFAAIVGVLQRVAAQDRDHGWDECFDIELA